MAQTVRTLARPCPLIGHGVCVFSPGVSMTPDRKSRLRHLRQSPGVVPRVVLGLALLLPLVIIALVLSSLRGAALASPTDPTPATAQTNVVSNRRIATSSEPPPTLVAPVATPTVAATVAPASPEQAAPKTRQYTVRPGDELRNIATQYNVTLAKIIANNDIPNPDSLRVGQVLTIPES